MRRAENCGMQRIATALVFLALLASCMGPPAFDRDIRERIDGPSRSDSPEGTLSSLNIVVLDVGQGDATLLEPPGDDPILIDTGPQDIGAKALFTATAGIRPIVLGRIILTHCHEDHIGDLAAIIAGPDGIAGTQDDTLIKGGIYVRDKAEDVDGNPEQWPCGKPSLSGAAAVRAGDRIDSGDLHLEAVASAATLENGTTVQQELPPDENSMSIALIISYNGFRMLIPGDITGGGGDPPFQTPDIETALAPLVGDIDVLRVAHHGSQTSTNEAFLDETKPEVAIISTGDGNDYGHPHRTVIQRLLNRGVSVWQTERGWLDMDGPSIANGDIRIEVSDDGSYRLRTP